MKSIIAFFWIIVLIIIITLLVQEWPNIKKQFKGDSDNDRDIDKNN